MLPQNFIRVIGLVLTVVVVHTKGLDFGFCEHTVLRTKIDETANPPRPYKANVTIVECCQGFTTAGKRCIPNCKNVCVNSHCIGNNKCQCNSGYYPVDNFRCLPTCDPQCGSNMACMAPNKCFCKPNYKKINESYCEPLCSFTTDSFECINAKCVAPDECECFEGHRKVSDFQCEPICTNCHNGECVATNMCECYEGYKINLEGSCEPICDPECINAKCVAPNSCECDESYEKYVKKHECFEKRVVKDQQSCLLSCHDGVCSDNGICICGSGFEMLNEKCLKTCDKKCANGKCLEDQCVCFDGYKLNKNSTECEPICAFEDGHDCVNGICVAPQTCQCFNGYHLLPTKNCTCVLMCNPPCINGVCTEDGCVCHKNFYNISKHECIKDCNEGFKWVYDDCIEDNSQELFGNDNIEDSTDLTTLTDYDTSTDTSTEVSECTTDHIFLIGISSEEDDEGEDEDEDDDDEASAESTTIAPIYLKPGSDKEKSLLTRIITSESFVVIIAIITVLIIAILASFYVLYTQANKKIYYVQDQEKSTNCVYFTAAQNEPAAIRELECSL